jgi:hypothetical protein
MIWISNRVCCVCNQGPAILLVPLILLAPRFGKLAALAALAALALSVHGGCPEGAAMTRRRRPPSRPPASTAAPRAEAVTRVSRGSPQPPTSRADSTLNWRVITPTRRLVTILRLGLRPDGWSVVACCAYCGPVYLPLGFADSWYVPRCFWCRINTRGLDIQRPAVTCEGCRYFQRHAADLNGRGNCVLGQGQHRPGSYHVCAWWRP